MTYSSKRNAITILSGVILIFTYTLYALGKTAPATDDLSAWAKALLIFIGIGVGITIILQIVFHIWLSIGIALKEKDLDNKQIERIIKSTMVEDERDKLISLKSNHIGYICAGAGFVIGLIALAFSCSAVVVLHIIAGSFTFGSFVEGCVGIYFNEKGISNA